MGYTKTTCTEELCKWNQCFVKKVEPLPISRINFYKDKAKERVRHIPHPTASATDSEKESLLRSLSECTVPPLALSAFTDYHQPFIIHKAATPPDKLPLDLRTLYQPDMDMSQMENAITTAIDKIGVSSAQVEHLDEKTQKQAASVEWNKMRCGRITASVAHSCLHTDVASPSDSLIRRICMPSSSLSHVPAVRWGTENEGKALSEFKDAFSGIHENVNIRRCGLRISKQHPFLGASPDAVLTCSCCGSSVVEVKCPYKHRDEQDISEIYKHKDCCLAKDNSLKKHHAYYTQVQMQMFIFNMEQAQFVFWTPNILVISRVARDNQFIENAVQNLFQFWPKNVLTELITRKLELGQNQTAQSEDTGSAYEYCLCKEDKGGKMIGCDNPQCAFKWFHLSCLKRKTVPKGSWLCSKCKPCVRSKQTV